MQSIACNFLVNDFNSHFFNIIILLLTAIINLNYFFSKFYPFEVSRQKKISLSPVCFETKLNNLKLKYIAVDYTKNLSLKMSEPNATPRRDEDGK